MISHDLFGASGTCFGILFGSFNKHEKKQENDAVPMSTTSPKF